MLEKAQEVVWNQKEYEVVDFADFPVEYFENNKEPAIIVKPDGTHLVVDLSRDGIVTHILPEEDTEYGLLEATVIDI